MYIRTWQCTVYLPFKHVNSTVWRPTTNSDLAKRNRHQMLRKGDWQWYHSSIALMPVSSTPSPSRVDTCQLRHHAGNSLWRHVLSDRTATATAAGNRHHVLTEKLQNTKPSFYMVTKLHLLKNGCFYKMYRSSMRQLNTWRILVNVNIC